MKGILKKSRRLLTGILAMCMCICISTGMESQAATAELHSKIASSSSIKTTATKVHTIWDMTDYATYGGNALQGGCKAGDYFYQVYVHTTNETYANTIGWIRKYNFSTGEIVMTSAQLNLGHGNDMTYNSKLNKLVLLHFTPVSNRVEIINCDTLAIEQSYYISKMIYCIDYNATNDEYVVGINGQNKFAILDSNFSPKGSSTDYNYAISSTFSSYTAQGCACDDSYIYLAYWEKDVGNYIAVYNWSGTLVSTIEIPYVDTIHYEMEYLFIVDGVIYFGTNNNSTSGMIKNADLWKVNL